MDRYQKLRLTNQRIARLGFLIGSGWDAKSIAADPVIAGTRGNVCRQARRFGISFRSSLISQQLRNNPEFSEVFIKASAKRGITLDALIRRLLTEIAEEPCLLDNILDDGV